MKPLCKVCPQSAVCITDGRFGGILDTAFYPQRHPYKEKAGEVVFACFAPHRTGEQTPSNGGGPLDVFRVSLRHVPEGILQVLSKVGALSH